MYNNEFEGVSDVEISYGNLEDKIGGDISAMITNALAPVLGVLGDAVDYVSEGFWQGIDYAQDTVDSANNWVRETTGGIGEWLDDPEIVCITEPCEY